MKAISNKVIVIGGGVLLIVLGLYHLTFWDTFDWSNQLGRLSQDNQSLVQMMNICTVCYLVSMGIILLCSCSEITESRVGRLLLISLSVFFALRLVLEFVFPGGSVALGVILLICIVIYAVPLLRKN